jgi:CO/xanthine dehydrogenase Mo-binding subunit
VKHAAKAMPAAKRNLKKCAKRCVHRKENAMSTSTKVMGAALKRKEDPRLITGEAKYLDDVKLTGMVYAAILRSPYAHAKIKRINTEKAKKHPGVVAVFTGEDFKDLLPLPCAWQAEAGRIPNNVNTPRALEIDRVTHTGAGVAVVIADDRYVAEDALGLIEVDYEPCRWWWTLKSHTPARRSSMRTRRTISSLTGRSATKMRRTPRSNPQKSSSNSAWSINV